MPDRIPPIRIPRSNVIQDIPPAVIRDIPTPPVTRGIQPPVVDVPNPTIEYPIIDVPTQEEFEGDLSGGQGQQEERPEPIREMPVPSGPSVNVGGMDIPVPEAAVIATAAAAAVTATTAGLIVTQGFSAAKNAADPFLKRLAAKKKFKVKIKNIKPVLHYIENTETGHVDIFEYSAKGTRMVDSVEGSLEQYVRDQIEIDSLYELDNKVIIDDVLKKRFTKEGAKRFKNLFTPAKSIAKKLSAKFSF